MYSKIWFLSDILNKFVLKQNIPQVRPRFNLGFTIWDIIVDGAYTYAVGGSYSSPVTLSIVQKVKPCFVLKDKTITSSPSQTYGTSVRQEEAMESFRLHSSLVLSLLSIERPFEI